MACRCQPAVEPPISELSIPLYKVVRIQGSVGWKSWEDFSNVYACGSCKPHRCLYEFSISVLIAVECIAQAAYPSHAPTAQKAASILVAR